MVRITNVCIERVADRMRLLPNKRLKLAAPGLKGIIMFVIIRAARRSLSATR